MDKIPVVLLLQDDLKSQHISITTFQTYIAFYVMPQWQCSYMPSVYSSTTVLQEKATDGIQRLNKVYNLSRKV